MTLPPINETLSRRRHDLDWLRVIAFSLLIFYHAGMFYVTWGWHVKSVHAGPALETAMLTVNPWRLALLFFISGVAVRFASDKTGTGSFALSRLFRLGVPIVFGMAVVVAPQTYFELRQAGAIEPGYLRFWPVYLDLEQAWPMLTPTWNHLWYVVYLLAYILLIAPILPMLRRMADGAAGIFLGHLAANPVTLLIGIAIPFILYEYLLTPQFPTTHTLWGDWANHAHRLSIFLLGYMAAKNERFWKGIARGWPWAATVAVALWLFSGVAEAYWPWFEARGLGGPLAASEPALVVLYAWSVIVSLLGIAQRVLNRPSPALRYLTDAVFCYYIVHQTITVSAGYWLTTYAGLGPVAEGAALVTATVAGCAASYEIFRRIPGLRMAFGIRKRAVHKEA